MTSNDAQSTPSSARNPAPGPDGTTQGLSGAQTGRVGDVLTTPERLDACPIDTVLLLASGQVFARTEDGEFCWQGVGSPFTWTSVGIVAEHDGPIRVLHLPGEPQARAYDETQTGGLGDVIRRISDPFMSAAEVEALAARADRLERERDEAEAHYHRLVGVHAAATASLEIRLSEARAQVERVRALHVRVQDGIAGQGPRSNWSPTYGCSECSTEDVRIAWPCPTVATLAGTEGGL
jgi:hypothetical protein